MKYSIEIDAKEHYTPIYWCYDNISEYVSRDTWWYMLKPLPSHNAIISFAHEHDYKAVLLRYA